MGTWCCPSKKEQAIKLADVLSKPLLASEVSERLSGLIGDDDLFDRIDDAVRPGEPDTDISFIVANKLENWLANLDQFFKPWDEEAITIVQNTIEAVRKRHEDEMAARTDAFRP